MAEPLAPAGTPVVRPAGVYYFTVNVRPLRGEVSVEHLERLSLYNAVYGACEYRGWHPQGCRVRSNSCRWMLLVSPGRVNGERDGTQWTTGVGEKGRHFVALFWCYQKHANYHRILYSV